MSQFVFTFYSPVKVEDTFDIIERVITSMKGKTKRVSDCRINAEWRVQKYHSKQYHTVFPTKCSFYVGEDMVRTVIPTSGGAGIISTSRNLCGMEIVWNAFIESLTTMYPHIDFGMKSGTAMLDAIKIVGDGTEQVFTATSWNNPSWGGALLGDMLFGTAGAIVGGMGGITHTFGRSATRFSDKVFAKVRYTNGLTFEGEMLKTSPAYNEIMVNMSRLIK